MQQLTSTLTSFLVEADFSVSLEETIEQMESPFAIFPKFWVKFDASDLEGTREEEVFLPTPQDLAPYAGTASLEGMPTREFLSILKRQGLEPIGNPYFLLAFGEENFDEVHEDAIIDLGFQFEDEVLSMHQNPGTDCAEIVSRSHSAPLMAHARVMAVEV